MKFEKRFNAEIVPEWKIKYVDYKSMKKKLRNIQREKLSHNKRNNKINNNRFSSNRESVDSRSHLEQTEISSVQNDNKNNKRLSTHSQAFSVNSVTGSIQDFFQKVSSALVTLQKHDPPEQNYSPPAQITSLNTLFEEVDHKERLFFVALDGELDKIERFYRIKETEAITRMNLLVKQYEILKEKKDNEKKKEKKRSVKILVQQGIDYLTSQSTNANANTSKSSSTVSLESPNKIAPISLDEYYKTAEKNIKRAVFEFYRGAELLRKYRVLNYNGISKLLKTYDKVSGRNGFEIYIQKVKLCYFFKSNVMKRLLKDAEEFYADNFEDGSRSRTIRKLRTPNKKNKSYYLSTLRVGLCLGLASHAIIRSLELIRQNHDGVWHSLLLLYAGLLLPIILALLIGVNMYAWTRSRVNYRFILELDPRSNLDFRQFLELPAIIFLVAVYIMFFNFLNAISYIKPYSYPILLVMFIGAFLLNPYPIFYYKARKWIIFSMARLLGSGLLRVEFRDYFLADLLTSLSYSMATFQIFACDKLTCNMGINVSTPILGSIPALCRLLQCFRRYSDTKKSIHIINLCKYGSIITSIWMTFGYNVLKHKDGHTTIVSVFLALWWIVQMFTTIYTFGWDVKVDWSLFKLHSVNYLLRDELAYENHWVYYFAIISNFFLRFSWVFLRIFPESTSVVIAISFGEVLRRWQWNFFRFENEHVINCGEFRAVKEIPLPFQVEDILIGDEDMEATDYDRRASLTSWSSWSKKMFARNRNLNPADSWKDFEPRNNTSEYGYSEIFEESEDSDDDYDDNEYNFDTLNARNTMTSIPKTRGSLGLSNIYASRAFLPINEQE